MASTKLTAINWAARERRSKMSSRAADREDEGTIYVAYWSHTPENCPGRSKGGAKMLSDFWARRDEFARKGIKILGGYVTVTGHAYYILLQAKDFATVTEFSLPLVPTQTGTFIPVLTMDEWIMMNQPK
jgi:hypothetical protein